MKLDTLDKATFFSLYHGQNVLSTRINIPRKSGHIVDLSNWLCKKYIEDCYLLLKPLSKIEDEDAIQIAIFNNCTDENSIQFKIGLGRALVGGNHPLTKKVLSQVEADYLRGKGYAVPFKELTISDFEKFGWIEVVNDDH